MAGPRADPRRDPDERAGGPGLVGRVVRRPRNRPGSAPRRAAALPLLVIADLLGAHWYEVPTVDHRYWTVPPETVGRIRSDPGFIRVFGIADKHPGEPGYASEEIDFLGVRDPLDWSLPLAWDLPTSKGNTPMYSRRLLDFGDPTGKRRSYAWRKDLEGDTHIVFGERMAGGQGEKVGTARLQRNPGALPRARIVGRPLYALDHRDAVGNLIRLGNQLRDRVVVEDPSHPLDAASSTAGTARIVEDFPERVVVEAKLAAPGYLVLADTFDPGWSATVDGRPAPIRPAYVAFRAVYLTDGRHTVVFTYRPAGFTLGLALSVCGVALGLIGVFLPRRPVPLSPDHAPLGWFSGWRTLWFLALAAFVLASAVTDGPGKPRAKPRRPPDDGGSTLGLPGRWWDSVHTFTWGSGEAAMKANRG